MKRSDFPKLDFVCFASAFAYERAPNITHVTIDGEKTECGRREWATHEGWIPDGPDCLICKRAFEKLNLEPEES